MDLLKVTVSEESSWPAEMIASLAPTRRSRLLMTRAFSLGRRQPGLVAHSIATPPIVPSHSPARPLVTAPLRAGNKLWWAPGAGAGLQSYDGWDGNMMTGDTRKRLSLVSTGAAGADGTQACEGASKEGPGYGLLGRCRKRLACHRFF
ncbi:hypothetical protein BN1723_010924 [Verticillium longisporum]|uniref:Uncharacterized protein n=1 Tax=Verticillium longisporum TaxID=100787 RepID=A0A0G4L2T2_VERLO|nr:hypothetical protein BN1723_010924 [Verticillium longisporum]